MPANSPVTAFRKRKQVLEALGNASGLPDLNTMALQIRDNPAMTQSQAMQIARRNGPQTGSVSDLPNVGKSFRDWKNAGQWAIPYAGAAAMSAPSYAIGAAKYGVPEMQRGYREGGIPGALGGLTSAARMVPGIGNASVDLMDLAEQYADQQGASGMGRFLVDMGSPDPMGKIGALSGAATSISKALGGLSLAGIPPVFRNGRRVLKPELDPYNFSNIQLDRPFDEIQIGIEPTAPMPPRKSISIEDLEGKIAIPLLGDRSALGGRVRSVDEIELANPVLREGGPDFMQGPAADAQGSVWASHPGVISGIAKRTKNLQDETGRDVVGVYTAMGPHAVDFASFTARTLAEMIPGSKITKRAKTEFDREMKAKFPQWPGIDTPDLGSILETSSRDMGKQFIKLMDKSKWKNEGFPYPGKARAAVTEPDLYGAKTGDAGFAIAKLQPDVLRSSEVQVPHSTYKRQIKGEYLGGLDQPVRAEDMFSDWSQNLQNSQGKAWDYYTFSRQNPHQLIDAEMVDKLMRGQ